MRQDNTELSPLPYARSAGLLYLVIILCGVGGEAFIRAPLLVDGDAAQSVANLLAVELPFRLSILADVVMALADVALGVLLYVLLKPAGRVLALMAMAFRLAQASILGLNLVHLNNALTFAHDGALAIAQRDVLVTSSLGAHAAGYDLGLFFFAINCFLTGALVVRADFLPRWAGWLVGAAGVVYLVGSALRLVAPEVAASFAPAYGLPLIAELAFCGWLLVRGVDVVRWRTAEAWRWSPTPSLVAAD
jgi:hypothetical protein